MIRRRLDGDAATSAAAATAGRTATFRPISASGAPDRQVQPKLDSGGASRWGSSPEPRGPSSGDDAASWSDLVGRRRRSDLVGRRRASDLVEYHDDAGVASAARIHRRAKRVSSAVERATARPAGPGTTEPVDEPALTRWGSAPDSDGPAVVAETSRGVREPCAGAEERLRPHPDRTADPARSAPAASRPPRGRRPPTKASDPSGEVRIAQRRAEVLEAQRRARRRWRTAMWGSIALVSLAVMVVVSPLGAVSRIDVTGATNTPIEQIRIAGATGSRPLVFIRRDDVRHRVERLPWVARVRVRRILVGRRPTLGITVIERVPVAAVRVRDGRWLTVDAIGRVLTITPLKPTSLIGVSVERLAATPVSARILAARIVPVLRSLTPIAALADTDDAVATLSSVFADAVPEASAGSSAVKAGIAALAPGRQVPITARRGVLVARSLAAAQSVRPDATKDLTGSTPSTALVQVDGDRVRVLVTRPPGRTRASNRSRLKRNVAFDFGAVDVPPAGADVPRGSGGGDLYTGEAIIPGGRESTVERRVRAFEILLRDLDLTQTLLVDLSVPDAPVVTPI